MDELTELVEGSMFQHLGVGGALHGLAKKFLFLYRCLTVSSIWSNPD